MFSEHAHALNWAIVDVTNKQYYADPILDRATPEILRKQLADGTYDLDSRMSRAFMEVVNKGQSHSLAHFAVPQIFRVVSEDAPPLNSTFVST